MRRAPIAAFLVASAAAATHAQLSLEFIASSAAHEHAARTYRSIWDEDGERIVAALEGRTCMPFQETSVAAVIDDAVSHSGGPEHPMGLRASYDLDVKRATLVHELGHRHLWQLTERLDGVDGHQTLYLFLDRVWADVWGQDFAAERIRGESSWQASYDYAAAWSWTRQMTPDERSRLWNRLLGLNGRHYCHALIIEPSPRPAMPAVTTARQ